MSQEDNILNIITITRNDFEGLAATIESTRKLRAFPGVRQIVVDGSDELTADKIKELISEENAIQYFWQPPSGISSAFNAGLDLADAQWVWFLNGRDAVHPGLKSEMLLEIISACHADILIFELEFMQTGTRSIHPPMWALWPPVQFWVPHPATLVRRNTFENHGRFSEQYKIAMDGEIWFRFFSRGALVDMLSIPIVRYDEGGLSRLQPNQTAREGRQIIVDNLFMLTKQWFLNGVSILKWLRHFQKRSRSN